MFDFENFKIKWKQFSSNLSAHIINVELVATGNKYNFKQSLEPVWSLVFFFMNSHSPIYLLKNIFNVDVHIVWINLATAKKTTKKRDTYWIGKQSTVCMVWNKRDTCTQHNVSNVGKAMWYGSGEMCFLCFKFRLAKKLIFHKCH